MTDNVRIVLISIPRDEAKKLARQLVEERFAACVNVIPKTESYYWWDDEVQHDDESVLIVKSTASRFDALCEFVITEHPFDLPEILALKPSEGLPDYLTWVASECEKE